MSEDNGFNFRSGWLEPLSHPDEKTTASWEEEEDEDGNYVVYICHPLSGDIRGNMDKVKEICMAILEKALKDNGYSITPVAPQLLFPTFADDKDQDQRDWAMGCCLSLVERCDALWVMVSEKSPVVTSDMRQEISKAAEKGIPIKWLDPISLEEIC